MNTKRKLHFFGGIVLTALLWLTGHAPSFSQEYVFDVEIINVEDGLPHRMVYDVVQDKKGFIWINTQGAISRYDGYNFKTYNASFLNIGDNKAAYMAIDTNNRLWYCEKNSRAPASNVIDTEKDSIYTMETISKGLFTSKEVMYLKNSDPGSHDILIITKSGLVYRYDGDFKEIYRFPHPFSLLYNLSCKTTPGDSYWMAYNRDLIRVKNGKIAQDITSDVSIARIISTYPRLIVESGEHDSTIKYWTLENNKLIPYTIASHAPEAVKGLLQFHKDYSCYATKEGLLIRGTRGKLLYSFEDFGDGGQDNKLMPNTTFSDRQNILWAATENGLLKLTVKKNPFQVLQPGIGMRAIFKDRRLLWLGGGAYRESIADTIRLEQEYLGDGPYDAMSFYKDLRGHLWIGTNIDKVVEYIPDQDTYIHYGLDEGNHSFHLPFQNHITGNYWTGSDNGLFRLDIITKKFTPFPLPVTANGLYFNHVHQNAQGIWLAGSKGIFLIDAQKETLIKHYSIADGLPSNSIFHIHEDSEGIFWLGTKDAGLVRWDLTTNNFRQYTREDELSNNKIYAVYEDESETLWLPSDYGLMAFDKSTANARVYLPKDGIAHEEFNRFSHFRDEDGTLYFGGLSGITRFHPAVLKEEKNAAIPMYVTRVRTLEKDMETFTEKTNTFKTAQKISLNPSDRILELDVSLLDYENSSENRYAYKLSGKQQQWIYTTDNKIAIINPPYGKYDLLVKARGASGVWSENQLAIPMYVKAPFYMQWWFILLLASIIIVAVIIGVRWRIRKLRSDRDRLEGEVQKRTRQIEQDKEIIQAQAENLKTLDRAKSRFFANITHEFRTPLTLITGPAEQLISKKPPEPFKKGLYGILKNARNLMNLINQLLDLSKLEGGRMKVETAHGDIVRYTRELTNRFQFLAHAKQLQLKFTADKKAWKIHFDSDKWTKIIYNLLSNAVKFTFEGRITVHLTQVQQDGRDCIECIVKDTGIGIAPEKTEHIFDRFYQEDTSSTRLQGGTGIGLSLVKELTQLQNGTVSASSVAGKGTEFTVRLPLMQAPDMEVAVLPLAPEANLFPLPGEVWAENEQPAAVHAQEKSHMEKLELLIVEDNAEMRSYIRSCIDETTYHISEAANGEEGIEMAQQMVPDLIISDVMMPKKNGFELTMAIRNYIATSHIPLILLTAKASLESRLEGLERGADAYLTKPFSPEELALRIRKLIELRKLLLKRYQNPEAPLEKNTGFEKEDRFISELKVYIITHISNPDLGVEDISTHFAMSRRQLYRKLKTLANMSVAHYIRGIRLREALRLLKQRKLNVAEIAYETGFSPSSFSKIFKKVYGKAPSEF